MVTIIMHPLTGINKDIHLLRPLTENRFDFSATRISCILHLCMWQHMLFVASRGIIKSKSEKYPQTQKPTNQPTNLAH